MEYNMEIDQKSKNRTPVRSGNTISIRKMES